jgi:hypothetical protein
MCYLVTTIVPLFNILPVTIEDVNLTVKRNFEEIMSQTLVPNQLVIDSRLQPCWKVVDTIRVAIVHEILNKRLHIWITSKVRIFEILHTYDTITFQLVTEQIRASYAVNPENIRDVLLKLSECLRHDASVVDVLFDE